MNLLNRRRCLSLLSVCVFSNRAIMAGLVGARPGNTATERNSELRHRLDWSFGGMRQRGWNLYLPLIARLTGTDADPGSTEFARGIERWQRRSGLVADGVLELETWMAMVSSLQAGRRRGRGNLPTGELVLAPPDVFHDPARPLELRYVDAAAYSAYRRMYAAATLSLGQETLSNGILKIVSAYRSPSYQAVLRRRSPNSGRAGLAINSPHFTGRALDLYVGGEPVSTADWNRQIQVDGRIYRWLVSHGSDFGFSPYFYEPWHWEFSGIDSGS